MKLKELLIYIITTAANLILGIVCSLIIFKDLENFITLLKNPKKK